ncbi:hypothetical protein PVL29_016301 [Vitis rotundifolia]|uniref:non-specific serine/threonine protein kinase n=2 Tax=Vitis rotundifolia TaxID=103349 RepID=A0AA39DK40_VITRO|nr:hypothetical protein PVL29_016301 [Vitis rotundifolia]
MDSRLILVSLLIVFIQLNSATWARTNTDDEAALIALKRMWTDYPPNWGVNDPCGNRWEGIGCFNERVISVILTSMDLKGELSGDLQGLSELQTLDLSYNQGLTGSIPSSIGNLKKLTNLILVGCSFSGLIPDSIGSLTNLVVLSLNSNSFSGGIPPSIGNLSNLNWLDLTNNQLTGTIPISNGRTSGLDKLFKAQHFHLGKNQLSGSIPPELFSTNLTLIHLLLDNNQLTGSIPSTLGLVKALVVIRLDGNSLSGPVPLNIGNLTNVIEMLLSNNMLTGTVPDLTGMNSLTYLDMSNNSFDASKEVPSWFSHLPSLTTLIMERTELGGALPVSLFSLPNLQTVKLKNNRIDGKLDFGPHYTNQLQLVDLQKNSITELHAIPQITEHEFKIILADNPICQEGAHTETYCKISPSNPSYSTPNDCGPPSCSSDQNFSPNCRCAYPYMGTLVFRVPIFSDLGNASQYKDIELGLMHSFQSLKLPVDSVSLTNPRKDSNDSPEVSLQVFPFGQDRFNRTGISVVGSALSNQSAPFYFKADLYQHFEEVPKKSSNTGIIIGAAAGGSLIVLLLLFAGVYAFCQKRRAVRATKQSNPFAKWDQSKGSGSIPQLKGARGFTFEEIKKCTNNFSEANGVGSGGYGKVYRGILPTGQMLAIKRAKQESMQGGLEFKTELELLSRVHHKNVVGLVGFCFEHGEQMLVYEFVPSGSLKESLSGKSGIRLDWRKRLKVALGSARGLAYLHELAEPPIIHRDIKSNNILLDERLNAKVADFGLCKLLTDSEKGHVTTQVKGTMGYLDPEYYMSQQLTEKSDVYSFGVLMLELISARKPIERGKYIVKEVKIVMDKTKDLYNLQGLLDPTLGTTLGGFNKFVDLALRCVEESGADRPTMGEVVKEIENIMQLAGLNPIIESSSASASYEESSTGTSSHPYGNNSAFDNSVGYSPSTVEPK